ncbi:MAG: oxygen-independent coproporphyrinogen III oxidase [Defluviicoccus sp.]|nr:oxygen-independent coproporphyrinogen III oxidase [Defluviicoccus sp.]
MNAPAALAAKYDLRVPRYTSYPTAPHFSAAVDGRVYRTWLSELDPQQPLSLYFHIPFCDSMCWFCGCYTKIVQQYQPILDYLETLHREIGLIAQALPGRFTARHLHWGGGSPTMLKAEDWLRLVEALRQAFDIAADAELAVEVDPRDTTEEYVAALAAAGVNRVSIGVQDFDATVQAAVNRLQPFETVEQVANWLRQHGIGRLNLDLMYGLPHQTVARVTAMADHAVKLTPSRVALFGYAHVPWMKSHQKLIDESALPGVEERLAQYLAAADVLIGHGYRAIGLDHFALPGDPLAEAAAAGQLRRNFQGYTTDGADVLIGFGASAIGSLPQGYIQNAAPLKTYRTAIAEGMLPTARGIALDAEDRLRRAIIDSLMCALSVDLDAVCRAHGVAADRFAAELERLQPLAADGLVTIAGGRITVTDEGRPFVRLAAAVFDAYLETGAARHSRAV